MYSRRNKETSKKRRTNKNGHTKEDNERKTKGKTGRGGGTEEKDWLNHLWDWWTKNIAHTTWFTALSHVGTGIHSFVTNIFKFIWYVLYDVVVKNVKSVWFFVITGLFGVGMFNSMAAAGSLGPSFTSMNINLFWIFNILWGVVQVLFHVFGWISYSLIILLFGSNTFVSIIVSVVLSVIIGAFIAIYRTEHIKKKKADKKNTTISKKGGANRKTKKANASSSSTSKTTKGKTKSILDRMFNKKLLPKLNSIPKADMEELIKKDPLPFGIAILFGFIQETENGYVFSKDGLDRLKTSIHNSMDTLYDVTKENMEDADASTHVEDEHDDDDEYISNKELDLVSDSLEAMKLVHTASIHALAREAVDESNRETTGGSGSSSSRGSPSRRIKIPKTVKLQKEDIQWLHKKFPKNFEKAKKFGLVDDNMNFTENADKIIENENTKTVVAQ
jgi:hypothetical protein